MRRLGAHALVTASLWCVPGTASAAPPHRIPDVADDERASAVYTAAGFDNAILTVGLGASHGLAVDSLDRTLLVYLDVGSPVLGRVALSDYRVRAGGAIVAVDGARVKIPVSLAAVVRGTRNGTYAATGIGTELGVAPAYYTGAWLFGAEVILDVQWASHVSSSDFYRTWMYTDASDGWLVMPSSALGFGGRVGVRAGERLELLLRVRHERRGRFDHFAPPIHASLTAGLRL